MQIDNSRTEIIIGEEKIEKLANAHVAVFGLGGVGGYAVEALARSGIGHLHLYDCDIVEESNINRQILATKETIGKKKVNVAQTRIQQISNSKIYLHHILLTAENIPQIFDNQIEFVIDAIDDIPAKTALLKFVYEKKIKHVSCMGAGMKLDPTKIKVADISKTEQCKLAKAIRINLKKQGINKGIRCLFSTEPAKKRNPIKTGKERTIGSISYLPGIFGLTAAGLLINDIIE